jgi:hypothetical protein
MVPKARLRFLSVDTKVPHADHEYRIVLAVRIEKKQKESESHLSGLSLKENCDVSKQP